MIRLFDKAKATVIAVVALVAAALAVVWRAYKEGAKNESAKRNAATLEADKKANERMNEADVGTGDPDDDKSWLENRGKK